MADIDVTARVVPNFPAKVQGSSGVAIDKTNGVYTISLDLDQFSNQEGSILYRGPTSWTALLRGQDGQILKSTATSIEWGTTSAEQTFVGVAPIDVNTVGSTTTTSYDPDFYSANQGAIQKRGATAWEGLDKGSAGQVLTVNSGGTDIEWATPSSGMTWGAYTANPNAPTWDLTGIPSGVNEIQLVMFSLGTSGTSPILIQLGTSSGVETSTYQSKSTTFSSSTISYTNDTDGFVINQNAASAQVFGTLTLFRVNPSINRWSATLNAARIGTSEVSFIQAGAKALAGEIDRIRITTRSGTENVQNGGVRIGYE